MRTAADVSPAEAFLDTLRAEQAEFLDALWRAGSVLESAPGETPPYVATHVGLTRQFFDAQRSLMARRAEFDAEIASLVAEIAAARGESTVAAGWAPPMPEARIEMLDDAAPQQQLAALLDIWWAAENERGAARLESARMHLARVHRQSTVEASPKAADADWARSVITSLPPLAAPTIPSSDELAEPLSTSSDALPSDVMDVILRSDTSRLDSLFDELVARLGTDSPAPAFGAPLPPPQVGLAVRPEAVAFVAPTPEVVAQPSALREFATTTLLRVILPMAAAVGLLALVLAWIG